MELRQVGASGLFVSAMGFGTMTFGGRGWARATGETQLDQARSLVDICLEAGVNFFDTADIYSDGRSEEILGAAVRHRRDDVVLATKFGVASGPGPNAAGASRRYIMASAEASLRRLGVDHIDLYQLHTWDALTPLEETFGALDDLVRQGKVRYVGCSNLSAWQMMKALGVARSLNVSALVSHQVHYTLHSREAEHEIVPAARDQGVGLLIWSPLAGGLLSGKYTRDGFGSPAGRFSSGWSEPPVNDEERLFRIIDTLRVVGAERGLSPSQVALAWLTARPGVTSVVVGARTREQLLENLGAATLRLSNEETALLDGVSAGPLPYPLWHRRKAMGERRGPIEDQLEADARDRG